MVRQCKDCGAMLFDDDAEDCWNCGAEIKPVPLIDTGDYKMDAGRD